MHSNPLGVLWPAGHGLMLITNLHPKMTTIQKPRNYALGRSAELATDISVAADLFGRCWRGEAESAPTSKRNRLKIARPTTFIRALFLERNDRLVPSWVESNQSARLMRVADAGVWRAGNVGSASHATPESAVPPRISFMFMTLMIEVTCCCISISIPQVGWYGEPTRTSFLSTGAGSTESRRGSGTPQLTL
ncbi:hypothetical protein K491DRAFT_321710 [Lophiostoma macrostomum CBS 122681]|uniref:Uncharacterized protein n=1 Tax=Lophiostoma macrostomum CBS 122681 TaxID=1314788 RepID=A0A6A6TED4_9PLEO|nr:hypothetical protein K491DRAFT_321710 [Lophiostoma macrostomum CBS 122681]